MHSRVVDDGNGGWKLRENASYVLRTQAEIDAIDVSCR